MFSLILKNVRMTVCVTLIFDVPPGRFVLVGVFRTSLRMFYDEKAASGELNAAAVNRSAGVHHRQSVYESIQASTLVFGVVPPDVLMDSEPSS